MSIQLPDGFQPRFAVPAGTVRWLIFGDGAEKATVRTGWGQRFIATAMTPEVERLLGSQLTADENGLPIIHAGAQASPESTGAAPEPTKHSSGVYYE